MSDDNTDTDEKSGKAFTQEQVNALLAEQKRKLGERFADYDDVKTKAAKLDELEQASKSELQKLQDELAATKSELTRFQQEKQIQAWAVEITKDSPIPPMVLRGSTREELEEHFKQLTEIAPKPKRTPVPAGKSAGQDEGSRAVAALRSLRGAQ